MTGLSEKISLPLSEGTLKMLATRRALFEGDSQWQLKDFFGEEVSKKMRLE